MASKIDEPDFVIGRRAVLAAIAGTALSTGWPAASRADAARVAGVFTVPIEQKWVGTVHRALTTAMRDGRISYTYSDDVPAADYLATLRRQAESGVDLVVGEAFGIGSDARQIADRFPRVAFLMGDSGPPHGANFAVFDNWIHEPCYLMGIIAGGMTKSNRIGMVGGRAVGEVNRLFHAFIDGARAARPDVQYRVDFTGSWFAPAEAKRLALAQVAAGVDVLFAEREGVVDAAREAGVVAFGNVVDMNRDENGRGVVVASALWHMEPTINHAIDSVRAGRFEAIDYRAWSMMRKGGASLSPFHDFETRIPAPVKDRVRVLADRIRSGAFSVPINDDRPTSTF